SQSPLYSQPLRLAESGRVRARAFTADGQVSTAASGDFLVDPLMLPLGDEHWRAGDGGRNVSAAWSHRGVNGDVISQRSNIFLGSATDTEPERERYGTLRIYNAAADFGDGEIELELRSNDDDGLGVAFRVQDEHHHYLWATDLQRKF